jgi:HEAT repeat protein
VIVGLLVSVQQEIPFDYGMGQRLLLFLIIGIAVLLAFAIGFAVSVVLLRIKNQRKAAKWNALERKWDETILSVLEGEEALTAFWSLVAVDEELFCVNYILRYARWLTGIERQRAVSLAQPYLHRVAPRAGARDAERRARAIQTLGALGLATHSDIVVRALDDESPLVAMVAARALARKEHPGFLRPVLLHLHRFTTWSPNFLASLLAAVGPDAAPALREVLDDPQRPANVRAVVATALGYLYDYDAANVAATVLEADDDKELTTACLRLMGRVGREEHLPLVRAFIDSGEFAVRAAAASALGSLGREEDLTRLKTACEDESRWVALHAARALRDAGDVESLQQLAASSHARATLAVQVLSEMDE